MQYYRRLAPFKAISFDLDDTLYSNYPVMIAVDAKMQQYFQALLPAGQEYGYHFWLPYKKQALTLNPLLQHDVGKLRRHSYSLGFTALGYSTDDAQQMAAEALSYFVSQRSNFEVPNAVHQLLEALKQRWPLVAISNGNVDTKAINIAQYFDLIYHAGGAFKQKPEPDMFAHTCQTLAIKPQELLHVGDCGANDVIGAIRYGCQAAWISTYDVGEPLRVLPTLALNDVNELKRLL
ncbi:HAD-IA family hydrolase [Thalassotalea marina]|uniref:Haloacid dehalogenase n=1 Tax=Thalassotalea marina TaxID=1673741 RepID=A0A919BH46_9GAMM|nr:HAD-IA family hydrolase [Thalassotalea marina]GHF88841.1 haloacid dehalogenase [Thalassotalea marina]